jgi:hypothetical protein
MFQICPKCSHAFQTDSADPPDACPACGVIFSKYLDTTINRDKAALNARFQPKHRDKLGLRILQLILFVLAVTAVSFVYKSSRHHDNFKPSVVPVVGNATNSADQREFADLFNSDTSFASLATRGQYTVVEVYLDQCAYCRELEAALEPFQEKRGDIHLVRVHHPGTMGNSIHASSREEMEAQVKLMNARMTSYQLCGSPHVEVYDADKKPLGVDTCQDRAGTEFLWKWISTETGITRHSAPGLFTRM